MPYGGMHKVLDNLMVELMNSARRSKKYSEIYTFFLAVLWYN